jgi:hypothetical protein
VWGESLLLTYNHLAREEEPGHALCFLLDLVPAACLEAALRYTGSQPL